MQNKDESQLIITSLQNPRIKRVARLRKRGARDEENLLLVEGYREIKRALDNHRAPRDVFFCRELFLGSNEPALLETCRARGAVLTPCSEPVFRKMAYRDRPDGLLMLTDQHHLSLADIVLGEAPLLLVAESIEKPGNLGTILRSADATGVDAVIVCDRCTDIHNPNVVRASIGTLFTVPVIEATSEETLAWLDAHHIRTIATTPDSDQLYTGVDMTGGIALVVGSEQYGLRETWLARADLKVRIPMLGQCDSLNVAAAATIVLYEAVRQRG
ncbi:MAG: RNA methyltransferase [Verrucomicrobiae bacterium]|nr:RNA methyltransferase [Verrucomicrobiae bacterium]